MRRSPYSLTITTNNKTNMTINCLAKLYLTAIELLEAKYMTNLKKLSYQ